MNKLEEVSLNLGPKLNVVDNNDTGTIKINLNSTSPKKSVNFGPGADLLMNPHQQKKATSPKSDINLQDLNNLDNINITNQEKKKPRPSFSDITSNIFQSKEPGITFKINEGAQPNQSVPNQSNQSVPKPPLGGINNAVKQETVDGFKTFNEIPVTPDKQPLQPKLTPEEELREKLGYLRKLEALEKKGIQLTKKYSMESPLSEMKGEYEMIKADKEKKSSVKFQQKMLLAFVSGLEFLNSKFDPFDLKLDGWSEAINENIEEYDDVFGELHEKYGSKAKMAPELKLLFMLGGSAAMLHMTNTMFKSSMPGMDDIMRQNPELMAQFQNAAINSMNQSNPGFGGFMNGVMGGNGPIHNMHMQTPPMGAPQGPNEYNRKNPPQMSSSRRPDVDMSRPSQYNDGIDIKKNRKIISQKSNRPEMKGPSELGDILAGLKTKRISITKEKDNNSVVSINDLSNIKDLEKPKKTKRKPRSERNAMTLNFN
tara:strand:- start:452 stop:1900 length:1449 start_codon:yes stop_codon:yes gene_type:complete